jgi:hypothetical protein
MGKDSNLKAVVGIFIFPVLVTIVAFLGNFFFIEYQTTKASVILNNEKLTIYNAQIDTLRADFKKDIEEVKASQREIITILLEKKND